MFGSTVAHTHSIAQSKNTKRLQRSGKGPLHNGLFMQCSFILNLVLGCLQTQLQISHCIFSKMVSTHSSVPGRSTKSPWSAGTTAG